MVDRAGGPPSPEATKQLLAKLWQKNLPLLRMRLSQLDAAAQAAGSSHEQSLKAAATAHKLAGSLGMYGYPRATELASLLEHLFEQASPDRQQLQALTLSLRADLKQLPEGSE